MLILSIFLYLPYRSVHLVRTLFDTLGSGIYPDGSKALWLGYDLASYAVLLCVIFFLLRYRKRGNRNILLGLVFLCAISMDSYFYLTHIVFLLYLFFQSGRRSIQHQAPGLSDSALRLIQGLFIMVTVLRLWLISPLFPSLDTGNPLLTLAMELLPWMLCLVFAVWSAARNDLRNLRVAAFMYATACLIDAFLLKNLAVLISPQFILAIYLVATWKRDIRIPGYYEVDHKI